MDVEDICLADSATTHTILQSEKYFSQLTKAEGSVGTISGTSNLIEGFGKASFMLPNETQFFIKNALYSSKSRRNLLSFKDIRLNGFHIETTNENDNEYLLITSTTFGNKKILEKLHSISSGLYSMKIRAIESHTVMIPKFIDPKSFMLWHERLGHPGTSMMRRIIENSTGHPLKNQKVFPSRDFPCAACSQGKLIVRPSPTKVYKEAPKFLERIQGDICGPIHPSSGPFRYFMVLIDASTRWSHVCLLSSRNFAFSKLLAQIIKLRAQFPDHPIKSIRLDNAAEFSSMTFNDFCMTIGISIEHSVPHVHTQNGLAESLIKRLQLIARPLILRANLPTSVWGHAILHAANIIRVRPTAFHEYSPLQLVLGQIPNISHFRVFGSAVYVPIAPLQRTKMGAQRRIGIYVGFDSPSIIRYLEPLTGDVFTARYADCHFDEYVFPSLGGDKFLNKNPSVISWNASELNSLDPRTGQCEIEIQRIIYLQNIANQMPDAFSDVRKMVKSHTPAVNTPAKIEIPIRKSTPEELINKATEESKPRQKRGRPVGAKDTAPRKQRTNRGVTEVVPAPEVALIPKVGIPLEEVQNPTGIRDEHQEISMNYVHDEKIWDRSKVIVDDIFAFSIASNITIIPDMDPEPQNVEECRKRKDWPKWKDAIQNELQSLLKREVFGPVVQTPLGVIPVGNKWVFVRKRNEKNEIVRYKARLVAQGFSQRPGIDYQDTYSPVMDGVTFRFLLSMATMEGLETRLMDVVTAYLYGSLDSEIHMRIPEGLKMAESQKPRHIYSIKLQRSLYGLKQSGRMWYNRLSDYLIKDGYTNNQVCPCVFIKKAQGGFTIIAVYVDDLNLVGTPEELTRTATYLKDEFEMKDLGKTKFCLGIQVEHLSSGIFVHQTTYTERILSRFHMDKAHSLTTPMVVRSLETDKDPFRPQESGEEILGPEVPYLSAIGALMYLANCTRPDITFAVNLLARYSSSPTKRHWDGIKHILRYLRGSIDLGLFYPRDSTSRLVGYADAGYLSDPHNGRSQTGYVFTYCDTAISWKSTKQTMTATSSNHSEILAIHEASRECVWLRSIIQHIQESCGLPSIKNIPTIMYEDNSACIAQLRGGYIKGDRTKHISPKFFYTHELQKKGDIDVRQIRSCDNLADLFTKSLPNATFVKLRNKIGMRRLKDLSQYFIKE